MDDWKNRQHLRAFSIGTRPAAVVDDHQYALLFWEETTRNWEKALVLVSLDYHPDTDPPFWLYTYQKAMARDPARWEELAGCRRERILDRIHLDDPDSLAAQMPLMNNDEQIQTAMALGIIDDYHMINCMEKHLYPTGHHYLVPPPLFGSLTDEVFVQAGFDPAVLPAGRPLILDIDLDYFPGAGGFEKGAVGETFKGLVRRAGCITLARSDKYFDYLKTSDYTLAGCEADCIAMLEQALRG